MERYATAAEFGRDVASVAGTMTGTVDTEGATQAVRRISAASATVPQTRIDPMAQVAKPSRGGDTAEARTPARPLPAAKRSMVVPIAGAAVIVLALAGGAFALRGKGNTPPNVPVDTAGKAPPIDTSHKAAIDTSAKAPVTPNGGGAPSGGTQGKTDTAKVVKPNPPVNPSGGQTHTEPPKPANGGTPAPNGGGSKPAVDLVALGKQVHQLAFDPEWLDDPAKLEPGRQAGLTAFSTEGLPDSARAASAFVVAQVLLADASILMTKPKSTRADTTAAEQKRVEAGTWLDRAIALDGSKKVYRTVLNSVRNQ